MNFANITDYLLAQSLHIAVLFILVLLICTALKKKTAHLRYLLWQLGQGTVQDVCNNLPHCRPSVPSYALFNSPNKKG